MAVRYVDLAGVDSPARGGLSNPWGTIAYAVARLAPGDALYLRDGIWTGAAQVIDSQTYDVPNGTSWANPISVLGYPGEDVVIRPPDGLSGIRLTTGAPRYLIFQDFEIDGSLHVDPGIGASPAVIDNLATMIYAANGAHHCRFQRLAVGNCLGHAILWSTNGMGDAYSMYFELLDCLIHNAGNAVGDSGHGGFGINNGYGIYSITDDNQLLRNEFRDGCGTAVNVYGSRNQIRRNRIHRNGTRGGPTFAINIGSSSYPLFSEDNEVCNNWIYFEPGGGIQNYSNTKRTLIDFNSVWGVTGVALRTEFHAEAPSARYNILFGNGTDTPQDAGGTGAAVFTGNITSDPDFVDAAGGDLRITDGSAAQDAGVALAHVTDDFFGNARPVGADPDCGAHELGGTGGDGGPGETPGGSPSPSGGDGPGEPAGPGGGPSVGVVTDTYSDQDMQCPAEWENGFKEGLISRWGDVSRPASHPWTGDWQGSTFSFQIIDKQNRFRAQAASFTERFWNEPLTVRMTTRANRALYGRPFTVFCGPIIDAQPSDVGVWDVTLGDVVSHGMLSDDAQIPWRKIGDSFLSTLTEISASLDRDQPEPIIYGENTREPDGETSPLTAAGLRIKPIYLGIEDVDGEACHVWMVAGHAVSDLKIYVDGVEHFEFLSTWLIPHQPLFQSIFGAPYRDIVSDTYGNLRRYTLIYGVVGVDAPDDCATGERELTAAVWGIEDVGDGSGALIADRFEQYKHFLINYVANQGLQGYQSGDWLENPTWNLFDGEVTKVDEDSFDACTAIGLERLTEGYIGAAVIGFNGRASAKTWIADWNRSCGCRFGVNHNGQLHIWLLHPTEAIKAAAPLYTDAYEILDGGFRTDIRWDEHATAIQFKADYDHVNDVWVTNGVVEDSTVSENYGRTIASEPREYPFAPGRLQAEHLAELERRMRQHRPRYVRLEGTIGPDPVTDDSLGYRDHGDYLRYVHFDEVAETREERLGQVVEPGIRVGPRIVDVVIIDCEDLIDFDVDASPA